MNFKDPFIQELFGQASDRLLKRFLKFHQKNRHVYKELERIAGIALNTSEKCSVYALANYMRWNTLFSTEGEEKYKIPNDLIPLYGRLLVFKRPEFYDFFERRKMNKNRRT